MMSWKTRAASWPLFRRTGAAISSDVTAPIGTPLRILEHRLSIKRYPVCYGAHRAIDAMIELRGARRLCGKRHRRHQRQDRRDASRHAAGRRSAGSAGGEIQHPVLCFAAAALAGHVGFAQLNDAFLARDDLRDLMRRVEVVIDKELDPDLPNYCPFDVVTVTLKDGSKHESQPVARAKGHSSRPLMAAELRGQVRRLRRQRFAGRRARPAVFKPAEPGRSRQRQSRFSRWRTSKRSRR